MTADPEEFRRAIADRYAIERPLGAGGMATVYLAIDRKHGRMVAIKVLREELSAAVHAERFQREIQIAARLTHPHILAIFDSGEAAGRLYYVMPFVDGESLRARLEREGRLSVREGVRLVRETAMALHYAHTHGVVHRDVKPENVLLADRLVYIADFGIARAISGTETSLTTAGVTLGTPAYMSPEQIIADREIDGRSDIYSLGCVLHELLAGEPPFTGTGRQMVGAHLGKAPPALRALRPEVPPGVEAAVLRALEKSADDRFSTAEMFAEALGYATTGETTAGGGTDPSLAFAPGGSARVARVTAPAALPGPSRTRRSAWRAAVAGGALAVVALAGWVIRPWVAAEPRVAALDSGLLAVTPFGTSTPDSTIDLWREGIMDVLSRNFDGAGSIRTVPPSLVMKQRPDRVDRATAGLLGRALGARFVLFGSLNRIGRDSLRAQATLYDVATDSTFSLDVQGEAARVDILADSLTVVTLTALNQQVPVSAVLRGSLGAPSLPALKAFLHGEQLYRKNAFPEARRFYEQALQSDPTFALALRRMRGVLRGIGFSEFDSVSLDYALRAGRANRGLTPRESLLVAADSLAATLPLRSTFLDAAYLARLKRRAAILEGLASRFGDDPEVWTELGEVRFHFGDLLGTPVDGALDAFNQAIAIDSAYGPAFFHAIELGLVHRGIDQARPVVREYLRLNPGDERFRILAGLLDRAKNPPESVDAWLAQYSAESRLWIARRLARWPDSAETAVRLLRGLSARPGELSASDVAGVRSWLARGAAFRGHLGEAVTVIDTSYFPFRQVELAMLGALPATRATPLFAAWLRAGDVERVAMTLPWWALQRDTMSLRRAASRGDSAAAREVPASPAHAAADYAARAARAHLALVRGDSASALAAFLALPDSVAPWWAYPNRLTTARLHAARGELAAAAAVLDGRPHSESIVDVAEVLWWLERARIASRLGDRSLARRGYSLVARAWHQADPSLLAFVTEARQALARLETVAARP